jgi:hypothetical protein
MDDAAHKKLRRAMARLVACREDLGKHRDAIRRNARDRLDANVHAVGVASKAVAEDPDVLTYRYLRTQLTEGARLRAIEGRGAPEDGHDAG